MGKYDPAPTLAAGLLRTARDRAELTQAALADRAGVTQQTVSAYETGRKQPTLPTLQGLLAAAGFDMRVRLEPLERHDDALEEFLASLPPEQQAELERARRDRGIRGPPATRQGPVVPTAGVDVGAILDALEGHGVEYVVIGGFALELHDVAVPPTQDVDVTPASTKPNLERLAEALGELDARFRVFGGQPEGVTIPGGITASWLSEMVTITLTTTAGPLDIVMVPDGTTGFDDLADGITLLDYGERTVPVASLEDITRSKEAAGREKDLLVIPAIRAHLRRRASGLSRD